MALAAVRSKAAVLLLIRCPLLLGNCSMFCCVLLCVHSSFVIIVMEKREMVALLCLSFWCFVIVVWLLLTMPRVLSAVCDVVFPDYTHLLMLPSAVMQIYFMHVNFKLRYH